MTDQSRSMRVTLAHPVSCCLQPVAAGKRPRAGYTARVASAMVPLTLQARRTHRCSYRAATLTLPDGFTFGLFATNLGAARFMAVRPSDGVLFVADARGRILALPDAKAPGKADRTVVFASWPAPAVEHCLLRDWVYVGETDACLALLRAK